MNQTTLKADGELQPIPVRPTVRAHKKKDGLLLIDSTGKARFATWKERLSYWLCGALPQQL